MPAGEQPASVPALAMSVRAAHGKAAPSRLRVTLLRPQDTQALDGLGVSFVVARVDGGRSSAPVLLDVDYSAWKFLYGANFADRLTVQRVAVCAVLKPGRDCRKQKPAVFSNDLTRNVLTIEVQALPDRSHPVSPSGGGADAGSRSVRVTSAARLAETPPSPTTTPVTTETPAPVVTPSSGQASDPTAAPSSPEPAPSDPAAGAEPQAPRPMAAAAAPGEELPQERDLSALTPVLCDASLVCQEQASLSPADQNSSAMYSTASTPNGTGGTYAATNVIDSGGWEGGDQSGDFTYDYNIPTPPAIGGAAPDLTLHYSAQSLDGRTSSRNPQASGFGMGWDYAPGYVNQTFTACSEQTSNASTSFDNIGDLCELDPLAAGESAFTLTLGGVTGRLFTDGTTWRMDKDQGWRILRSGTNYWTVETLDGTKYYFGFNNLIGGVSESRWTVPVYSTRTGQCAAIGSSCMQPWRWNLDAVVDPNGNAQYYYYTRRTNNYSSLKAGAALTYTRGGSLRLIDYGINNSFQGGQTAARVVFSTASRCTQMVGNTGTCPAMTTANASSFPDVPLDKVCTGTSCTSKSPTFFETDMVVEIQTQVLDAAGAYSNVDRVVMDHTFPPTPTQSANYADYDSETPSLFLTAITRTGVDAAAGGPATVTVPDITFAPVLKPNRVNTTSSMLPMHLPRITEVITELGERIRPVYSTSAVGAACTPTSLPTQETNSRQCFPIWFSPANPAIAAHWGWYFKYVMSSISTTRPTGLQTTEEWNYTYYSDSSSTVLWDYDYDPATKHHAFSTWRGFPHVRTVHGTAIGTLTDSWYYTGLNGHPTTTAGTGSRSNTISSTDTVGAAETVTDNPAFAGRLIRQTRRTSGGAAVDSTRHDYTFTGSLTGVTAVGFVSEFNTLSDTMVSGSATPRRTRTYRTFDTTGTAPTGLPLSIYELGEVDVATNNVLDSAEHKCTTTTYVKNTTKWILSTPSEVLVRAGTCTATILLSKTQVFYDSATAITTAPTAGNVAKTLIAREPSGTDFTYNETTATYDSFGRPLSTAVKPNATALTTTITYTGGGCTTTRCLQPTSTTTTNPSGDATTASGMDWGRGLSTQTTDPNGQVTKRQYDRLGRPMSLTLPTDPNPGDACPSQRWSYTVSRSVPSSVHTEQRLDGAACAGVRYLDSYTYLDAAGRPMSTQTGSPNLAGAVTTWTEYDDRGLLQSSSEPFYLNTAPGTFMVPADPANLPTRQVTTYDPVERPLSTITYTADGADADTSPDVLWRSTATYQGSSVTTTPNKVDSGPTLGLPTTTYLDVWGRTERIDEPQAGGTTNQTLFGYDRAGNQTSVTDPSGVVRTATFNLLGQPLTSGNAEVGSTTNTYDGAGRLDTSTRNGITLTQGYDNSSRLTSVSEGGVPRRTWTYGTTSASNGRGRVISANATDLGGNTVTNAYTYDASGRPLTSSVTIPATAGSPSLAVPAVLQGTWTSAVTYDSAGHVLTRTSPSNGQNIGLPAETFTETFDSLGMPEALSSARGSYVTATDFRRDGLLQARNHTGPTNSNNVSTTYSRLYGYDPQIVSRLTNIKLVATRSNQAAATLQDDNLQYDAIGNPTDITYGGGARECFKYDQRLRLTRAYSATECATGTSNSSLTAGYDETYTYDSKRDALDAITGTRNVDHQYAALPSATAHQVTCTLEGPSGTRTTYDQLGRIASRISSTDCTAPASQTWTYTWDAFDQLTGTDVTNAAAPSSTEPGDTSNTYLADGTRVLHREGTDTTLSIAGQDVTANSNGLVKTTRLVTSATAQVAARTYTSSGESLVWLFNDRQNSAQISVDDNAYTSGTGTAGLNREHRTPFGAPRGPDTTITTRDFLNKPADAGTGLDHLGARYYMPSAGIFFSPDPLAGATGPASLNPYSYSSNNPARFSDPSGLMYEPGGDGGNCRTQCTRPNAVEKVWPALSEPRTFTQEVRGVGRLAANVGVTVLNDALSVASLASRYSTTGVLLHAIGEDRDVLHVPLPYRGGLAETLARPAASVLEVAVPAAKLAYVARVEGITGELILGRQAAEAGGGAARIPFGPGTEKAWNVLERVTSKGSPLPGYKGGSTFKNLKGQLPELDGAGNPVSYREWDVNPYTKGVNRGPERIVTGSDGSAYYTGNHYDSFLQFWGVG